MRRRAWWVVAVAAWMVVDGGGRAGDKKGTEVALDGLKSQAPAGWVKEETASKFRYAQFRVPKAEGDKSDSELIIFHFGGGQGGGVEQNIQRWKDMFVTPQGKKPEETSKVEKFKVSGVPVTYLDVHGTYKYKKAPFDEKVELRAEHRMLAVYWDSGNGPFFIRLVGPAKTLEQNKKGFDDWLKGFK